MIAIRSPSSSASSIECVVSNIILPFFIFFINCHVKRIEYGSIPLVGSSRIITCKRNTINNSTTFHTPPKKKQHKKQFFLRGKRKGRSAPSISNNLTIPYQCNTKRQFPLHASRKSLHNSVTFVSQPHLTIKKAMRTTLVIDHEPNSNNHKEKKRKKKV